MEGYGHLLYHVNPLSLVLRDLPSHGLLEYVALLERVSAGIVH